MTTQPSSAAPISEEILVGIDWADKEHAVHVVFADGREQSSTLAQKPEKIEAWIQELTQGSPHVRVVIALERSEGALVAALLQYPSVVLYPLNPAQLAKYRESMAPSRSKSDPSDARLLCQFLKNYRDQLRPLQSDDQATRELTLLVEERRLAVDQRTACSQELTACLKQYFPLLLELVESDVYAGFVLEILRRWPNFQTLRKVTDANLRKFFYRHHVRGDAVERKLKKIREAVPLTDDPALLSAGEFRARKCGALLTVLGECIASYDRRIRTLLDAHPDAPIVKSLPGSALHMQSRIIAALGTDRERFANAGQIQSYSGIAPVTRQSGRQRLVQARWACPKFLKQTFHEYAGLSIKKSAWARAFYDSLIAKGKTPNMAKRALAFKWIRIIFRCWKDRVPYDEARYIESLKRTNSPLWQRLQSTVSQSA